MQTAKPRKRFHLHAPPGMSEEEWAEAKDTIIAFTGTTINFAVLLGAILVMTFFAFMVWPG